MRYIRFLKPPRVINSSKRAPSSPHISCLITLTSDLGDSFLPCDVVLCAELLSTTANTTTAGEPVTEDSQEEKVLVWTAIQWQAGMRSLPITLPLSKARPMWPLRVRIGVEPRATCDAIASPSSHDDSEDTPSIISAWSAPLDAPNGITEADKLVERRLFTGRRSSGDGEDESVVVRIWEETGDSIARHLWDAGVVASCHMTQLLCTSPSGKPKPQRRIDKSKGILEKVLPLPPTAENPLNVLELGSGCGILGITLTTHLPHTSTYLTDLPTALSLLTQNITHAHPHPTSPLIPSPLDWDAPLPSKLVTAAATTNSKLHLIFAADVTYNPDSSPALVDTIYRLAEEASVPGVLVMVAGKCRHESEKGVFGGLMRKRGWVVVSEGRLEVPGDGQGEEEEVVEVGIWRRVAEEEGEGS